MYGGARYVYWWKNGMVQLPQLDRHLIEWNATSPREIPRHRAFWYICERKFCGT